MFFRKKCVFSPNFLLPAKTPFFRGENRRKRRKTNRQNGDGGNGTGRKKGKDGRPGGGKNRRRKEEWRAGMRGCRVNAGGTGRAPLRKGCAKNRANRVGTGRTSGGGQVRGEKQSKCTRRRQGHNTQRTVRGGARLYPATNSARVWHSTLRTVREKASFTKKRQKPARAFAAFYNAAVSFRRCRRSPPWRRAVFQTLSPRSRNLSVLPKNKF